MKKKIYKIIVGIVLPALSLLLVVFAFTSYFKAVAYGDINAPIYLLNIEITDVMSIIFPLLIVFICLTWGIVIWLLFLRKYDK